MTIRKAIRITIQDVLRRDPTLPRWLWITSTLFILPIVPLVVAYRVSYAEPERSDHPRWNT